jgi:Short C-terminal domain
MGKQYGLGIGSGSMIDNGDGTVSYRATGTLTQAFRIRVSEVCGFSVTKGSRPLARTLHIMGNSTQLASVSVPHGVAEKIEAWIRAHPDFRTNGTAQEAGTVLDGRLIADELMKLAQLRDSGVLTDEEFARQKARLLG